MLSQTQWRATFGEFYGLDLNVIIEIAKSLNIETDRIFFEKISVYEREALKILRNKEDICDEEQKKKCKTEFGEYLEWSCKNCEKRKVNAKQ